MASPFKWFSQVAAISRFSILGLPQRIGSSATAVFGIAGVVAVMVGVLSIAQGVVKTMEKSSSPGSVIVLRSGATSEMVSGLLGDSVTVIEDAPGLARKGDDSLASAELFVIVDLPLKSTGTPANVPLRGVHDAAFEVRDGFRMVEGRRFEPGLNEVIVGVGAQAEFAGLKVGSPIAMGSELWPVVGIFEAGGGISESELWADAAVLQQSYRRGNSYQTVLARLESPGRFQEFADALTTDPRLNVKVERTEDFYSEQSAMMYGLITGLGSIIAAIMGLGAVFGALNTMYTAVSARTVEIATLRALGFNSGPVVVSVLAESLFLALVGGVIGAALAWIAFDGIHAASINFSSFSQVTFSFDVTRGLLILGIVFALVIGLLGGLFPAMRAARQPIANALREM
jgi:putative ABC transport system permease protein